MRNVTLQLALAAVGVTALAGPATASDGDGGDWYGWQIVIPDVIGDALLVGGLLSDDRDRRQPGGSDAQAQHAGLPGEAVVGLVITVVDGPIVHGVHGRWGAAAGSFGLRLMVPAATWLASASPCGERTGCRVVALALGLAATQAFDAAVLAREEPDGSSAPMVVSAGGRF